MFQKSTITKVITHAQNLKPMPKQNENSKCKFKKIQKEKHSKVHQINSKIINNQVNEIEEKIKSFSEEKNVKIKEKTI